MDKKDPALVIPVVKKIRQSGKGVIGMKLVGNGKYRDDSEKIDASLRFVLNSGVTDMIIVGFEQPGQIDNYIDRVRNTVLKRFVESV